MLNFYDKFALSQLDAMISVAYNSHRNLFNIDIKFYETAALNFLSFASCRKMLRSLPTSEILYHVDITSTTVQGLQRGGALLLTPEVLYVVSSSEDMQQLTLPPV